MAKASFRQGPGSQIGRSAGNDDDDEVKVGSLCVIPTILFVRNLRHKQKDEGRFWIIIICEVTLNHDDQMLPKNKYD